MFRIDAMDVDVKPEVEELNTVLTATEISCDFVESVLGCRMDQSVDPFATDRDTRDQAVMTDICLLCCRNVDIDPTKSHRVLCDQLSNLLQILHISLASFEHLMTDGELPAELFCSTCAKQLFDAMKTLSEIDRLQNELKSTVNIMQDNLVGHQVREDAIVSKWINQARKTLVQCISPCKTAVNPSKAQVKSTEQQSSKPLTRCSTENVTDFENRTAEKIQANSTFAHNDLTAEPPVKEQTSIDGYRNFAEERLYPPAEEQFKTFDFHQDSELMLPNGSEIKIETNINEDGINDVSADNWKDPVGSLWEGHDKLGSDDDDSFSFNGEFLQSGSEEEIDVNELCEVYEASGKQDCKPRINETLQFNPESNRKYFNGKIISLDCPYCERKINREDYRSESGQYVFKCFPDCCNKTMSYFFNLVYHHEAYCPSKPRYLRPKKRATRAVVRNTLAAHSWTHDKHKKISAFECGICFTSMSRSNYRVDSGESVFKCTWDSCDKITSSFPNLCWHHIRHCSRVTSRKNQNKMGHGDEQATPRYVPGSHPGAGRRYDQRGGLVALECPCCENTLTYADFVDKSTNSYVFKCIPICCDKVFVSFPNLVSHHESRCKPVDIQIAAEISVEPGAIDHKEEATEESTEVIPVLSKDPEFFQCNYCHEEFKHNECRHVISEGTTIFCLPDCGVTFSSFAFLMNYHEATCSKRLRDNSVCNLGDQTQTVTSNTDLQFHNSKVGVRKNCKTFCNICGARCPTKDALAIHIANHSFKKIQCSICYTFFKRRSSLRRHHGCVHKDIPFSSQKTHSGWSCVNRVFDEQGILVSFTCPFCHNKLSRDDYACESGEPLFKCLPNCCDKVTYNFYNLTRHHEARCPSRPKKLVSKIRKKRSVNHEPQAATDVVLACNSFMPGNKNPTQPSRHFNEGVPEESCQLLLSHEDEKDEPVSQVEELQALTTKNLVSKIRKKKTVNREKDVVQAWNALMYGKKNPSRSSRHFNEGLPEESCQQLLSHEDEKGEPVSQAEELQVSRKGKNTHTSGERNSRRIYPKFVNPINDSESGLSSYDCPHCQRNLALEDYSTETDDYFFKCLSDGCDEIAEDFSKLVLHHQHCCPSKPGFSKTNVVELNVEAKFGDSERFVESAILGNENESLLVDVSDSSPNIQVDNECSKLVDPRQKNASVKIENLCNSFPGNCNETEDNVRNLISHCETFCSSSKLSSKGSKEQEVPPVKKKFANESFNIIATSISKTANRIFDLDGTVVEYDCPFCRKNFSRENYSAELNKYLSKGLPDDFQKSDDNFLNFISHHEVFCSSKPTHHHDIFDNPTTVNVVETSLKMTRPAKRTASDCELTRKSLEDNGFIYDHLHDLVAFHCTSCPIRLSRSDFATERGIFVFKCITCNTVTDNFVKLAFHHRSHCTGTPSKRQWMTPHKWIKTD